MYDGASRLQLEMLNVLLYRVDRFAQCTYRYVLFVTLGRQLAHCVLATSWLRGVRLYRLQFTHFLTIKLFFPHISLSVHIHID